jgi:hypothetical protein
MSDTFDPSSDAQSWLVIFTTYNPAEAHVIAGRLESAGFHPWVHQEPGGSALGITVGILGEIRVLVLEQEYEAALHLLEEGADDMEDATDYEEDEDYDYDDDDIE